ncbi:MAG: polymer-forming cytoskeletal protein [Patescibacteria group bacterium]
MFHDSSKIGKNDETIIGATVKLEGDFVGENNVVVEGTVRGSMKTKQNLRITPNSKIFASIEAQNATIAGEVHGNIKIIEQLELLSTARINGDIEAKAISVANGAVINGKISMGNAQGNSVNITEHASFANNHPLVAKSVMERKNK